MSGKNFTSAEMNKTIIARHPFRRVGRCRDCRGRCCNYISIGPFWWSNNRVLAEYWTHHGELVVDRWWRIPYVIIKSDCIQCTAAGKCNLWKPEQLPEACRQFPCTPFDTVYRYLVQKKAACGYSFVDRETGKPWNMRELDHEAKSQLREINRWDASEVTT